MHRTAYRLGGGLLLLFWNSYPEKEASNCSNILPLFLWAVLWWCCCYDLMLDSKCFSLPLMLPACSHKKLLLKWGDAGCEKVICLHCGNFVLQTPSGWCLFLSFSVSVFKIVQKKNTLQIQHCMFCYFVYEFGIRHGEIAWLHLSPFGFVFFP